MTDSFKLVGGVLALIIEDDKILMNLRKNKFDAGKYSLPGGKMEKDQTVKDTIIRELKEEIDILVKSENINIVSSMHRILASGWNSIEYIAIITKYQGVPRNLEPDKCEKLEWISLNDLPNNISNYAKEAIFNYKNNIVFSEIKF